MTKPNNPPMSEATLRDMFAGQALVGCDHSCYSTPEEMSRYCYRKADAMLAERSKNEE